jgi:hypothetical protein
VVAPCTNTPDRLYFGRRKTISHRHLGHQPIRQKLHLLSHGFNRRIREHQKCQHRGHGQPDTNLTIPITVLEKQDTTLHKLAARSMLNDLERGRSNIHLGSNRPYPGSWEETNMVRKEAEEIACKWSIVSKWTNFFLTEEPDSPTGQGTLIDGVARIDIAPGDYLLQPRGTITPGGMLDLRHRRFETTGEPFNSLLEYLVPGRPSQDPAPIARRCSKKNFQKHSPRKSYRPQPGPQNTLPKQPLYFPDYDERSRDRCRERWPRME